MKLQNWIISGKRLIASTLAASAMVTGCASNGPTTSEPASSEMSSDAKGNLSVRANGEDFVRQGFTSKDGWEIRFDHVYVTLADVTAYQTDPAYDPDAGKALNAQAQVTLVEKQTVDLAEGDDQAEPVLIAEVEAPEGRYNALSWQMAEATDGPAAGQVLMLVGTAQKGEQTVDFTLQLNDEITYTCGDFIGDERKGILKARETADLEATFHFDHIFGDSEAAPDDAINTGALGFDPLAALMTGDELVVDQAMLQQSLSPADYATLKETVAGLGHVGEGHCTTET